MRKIPLFSEEAKEVAADLGLTLDKANLEIFSQTLRELAASNARLLAVTSDSRGSGKLVPFAQEFPEQIIEVGIAEQNLVGVAAGLASTNRPVYAVSPSCFLTARSLEQIKNDVTYSNNRVNLIGISAGVSYGALGTTHHSLHDIAALRAINNVDIVVPGDSAETRAAILASENHTKPMYIRFGKAPLYKLYEKLDFEIGKAVCLKEGSDVSILANGELLQQAYLAARVLEQEYSISAEVISVHSIRPLDTETILKSANKTGAVITLEEHMVNGGLGEACASLFMQAGVHPTLQIAGIPDEYTVTGSPSEIFYHYDLLMEGIVKRVQNFLSA